MNMIAEFAIIGRVGKINILNGVTKVAIASQYPRKDQNGEWDNNTHWNTVTIFSESTQKWIADNLGSGDVVHTTGRMREASYQKDGATVYTQEIIATQFNRLAAKAEKEDDQVVD